MNCESGQVESSRVKITIRYTNTAQSTWQVIADRAKLTSVCQLLLTHKGRREDGIGHRTHLMMISLIPTTPCLSTSSATEKALCKGVFSGIICRSLHGTSRRKGEIEISQRIVGSRFQSRAEH